MKKILFVLSTIMIVFSGFTLQAQTLEEILVNHFETIGQDKLIQVQSVVTKGKIVQGNIEIPITGYSKRPSKVRMEGTFQGLTFISAYDGKQGWHLNPFMGDTLPQLSTDEELDELKDQADIDGMLYNYKEKGYTLELGDTSNFEGEKVYLLKLTKPNGNVYTHYMDAENYVILKTVSKVKAKGVEQEVETLYSDYKPVEGILLPFNIENKVAGNTVAQFVFDSFTMDTDIADSLFEMSSVTKFPKSTFSEEAQTKIDSLEWNKAKKVNSLESYKYYISNFPNGKYFKIANSEYDNLRNQILNKLPKSMNRFPTNEEMKLAEQIGCRYEILGSTSFLSCD